MNLINEELEQWIYTGNENNYNRTIIAVSNRGRIKTKDETYVTVNTESVLHSKEFK